MDLPIRPAAGRRVAARRDLVRPVWDLSRVRQICHKQIEKQWGMFTGWPDIGQADLMQLCLMRARKVHDLFDPNNGAAYITWITRAAKFALIDEVRRLSRRAKGQGEYFAQRERELRDRQYGIGARRASTAMLDWLAAAEEAGMPGGAGGEDETLAERLARVYCQALRTFPRKRHKFDPGRHNVATTVGAVLLMKWRQLSLRGAVLLLLGDPDLRAALRMDAVPSREWFRRAVSFVTDNLGMKLHLADAAPDAE